MSHEGVKSLPSLAWWTNVPRTISQVPNFFSNTHFREQVRGPGATLADFTREEFVRVRKVFSWSLMLGKTREVSGN